MPDAPPSLLYLSATDLDALAIPPPAIADAIAHALKVALSGRAWNVPKASIVPSKGKLFQAMLAASEDPPCGVVKAVGLDAGNAARGLPHIGATITVLDGKSGLPVAVVDGAWITGVRTAAISALAARYLVGPEPRTVGFVGCGEQARRHLLALQAEYPVQRVLATSRTLDGAQRFADWTRMTCAIEAQATEDADALVAESDIIVSSVPANENLVPFLSPQRLRPGATVLACDLARSWRAGIGDLDVTVIDERAQDAASDAPMLGESVATADLGELIAGARKGRTSTSQRAAFVFRGLALGDLAAAWLVYQRARQAGLGQVLGT